MKRICILVLGLSLALFACGGEAEDKNDTPPSTEAATEIVADPTPVVAVATEVPLSMVAQQERIGGTGTIADFEWSPDGRWIAAAGGAGVLLYDMTAMDAEPRLLPMVGGATLVAFSSDSRRVAAANGTAETGAEVTQYVYLFDVNSGTQLARASTGDDRVTCLNFSFDNLFLLGCLFQEVRVWDASDLSVEDAFAAARRPTVADMNTTNSRVAFYDGAGNLQLVNRFTEDTLTISLGTDQPPTLLNFINENREIVVGGEFIDLRIYNARSGELVYSDAQRQLLSAYVNRRGQLVASSLDGAYLYDLKDYTELVRFNLPRGYPSPNGGLIAVRQPETIQIYDGRLVRLGELRFSIIDRTPYYSHSRNFLAGYRRGGDRLYVIDPQTLRLLRVVTHEGRISGDSAAISSDGSLYAVLPVGGPLYIWDTQPWQLLYTFEYSERAVALAISPDNNAIAIAAGGGEPSLRILETQTGRELIRRTLDLTPNNIAYMPDGDLILVVADREVVLIDATSGQTRYTLDLAGHILPVGWMFTPDQQRLILFGGDGGVGESWINFYDLNQDFQLLDSINGLHRFAVTGVVVSANGDFMYTVGRDTFLNQWDYPSLTLIAEDNIFLDEMGGMVALNDEATELLTLTERGVMQRWRLSLERPEAMRAQQ